MIGLVVPIAKKMHEPAPDPEEIMETIEIIGMNQQIAQILKRYGCQSRSAVTNELIEIESETLTDNSLLLFNHAKVRYAEQLAHLNINDEVKIEQKKRRKIELIAADIIDLYMYVIGIRDDFPRQALKDVTLYRDITLLEQQGHTEELPDETPATNIEGRGTVKKKNVRFEGVEDGGR